MLHRHRHSLRVAFPTVNKHRLLFPFSFPYHSPSEVAVANDESPRSTGSSRTHCKFAISGFNSVVITFVAHIYSREMFRYGASCNVLYLSGYLQRYFLRERVTKLHLCARHYLQILSILRSIVNSVL